VIGSATDIIIVIVVAVVLLAGTSKIPEIFRSLGKAKGEFKKGELEAEMELKQMTQTSTGQSKEQKVEELQKQIAELQKQLEDLKKEDKTTS
jgi:Sec-independent protein translocase TatA